MPTDPDMEEDLVVVDDSELDVEMDEVNHSMRRSPSPSSAELPMIGSDVVTVRPSEMKGKTPYTTTMNLKKGPKGYGFSVTWTHPPRYVVDLITRRKEFGEFIKRTERKRDKVAFDKRRLHTVVATWSIRSVSKRKRKRQIDWWRRFFPSDLSTRVRIKCYSRTQPRMIASRSSFIQYF